MDVLSRGTPTRGSSLSHIVTFRGWQGVLAFATHHTPLRQKSLLSSPQPLALYNPWNPQVTASRHGGHCKTNKHRSRRTEAATSQGVTGTSNPIAVSQYLGRGPFTVSPPVQLQLKVGPNLKGPLDCSVRVFLPTGGQQQSGSSPRHWPLLVMSAGFLLHSSLYGSYAADLASWGLAVVLYDLLELVDDVTMVSTLGSILDACTTDPRLRPHVEPRVILLGGHSRGGKLSVLAASNDPRVKGIALLDPVDVTSMTPAGPGYPSALPALKVACGPPRSLPALVVGASRNTGVIPQDANYRRFVSSCPGPCWFLELSGAGHLQFLDAKVDLLSAFVESGPTPDEAVRRVSKAAILAWALELAVPLALGEVVNGRQVTERLQQTSALLQRQAPLNWSVKGLDSLGTSCAARSSGGVSRGSAGAGPASSAAGGSHTTTDGSQAGNGATSTTVGSGDTSTAGRGGKMGAWNYEELMRMRARELKAILVEHGVNCSDCFEKADLAKRVMASC